MPTDIIAKAWDKRNRKAGDPYKNYVLDPILLKLAQPKGKAIVEPEITPQLLKAAPRFRRDLVCPISLVFSARK